MTNRLPIIASFVLVTILATGSVELFCRSLSEALTIAPAMTAGDAPIQADTVTQGVQQPLPATTGRKGENYSIITRRNLFGKVQEKSPQVTAPPTPVLKDTALHLTLLGTISGDDSGQRAIIQDKRKKTQEIYQQSDTIEAALIKEIHRGKIILTVKGKDEVLRMEERKSSPSVAPRPRRSVTPKTSIRKRPTPRYETDDEPEELAIDPETLVDEGEVEESPAPTRPRRKISFKKNNNQVVEP